MRGAFDGGGAGGASREGIDEGASSHKRAGEDDTTAIAMHALLVKELDTLGWESVVAVDLDRVAATLTATDARGVAHHVEVLLTSTYPSSAPLVHAALPLPFALAWPPPGGASRGGLLGAVLDQFSNELERHQAVWRELDVFDEVCVCVCVQCTLLWCEHTNALSVCTVPMVQCSTVFLFDCFSCTAH